MKNKKDKGTAVEWSASDLFDRLFDNDKKILEALASKANREDIENLAKQLADHTHQDAEQFDQLHTSIGEIKVTHLTEQSERTAIKRFLASWWKFAIAASGLASAIAVVLTSIH